jgi:hypothetical protein
MQTADLEKYCEKALKAGVTDAKVIDPGVGQNEVPVRLFLQDQSLLPTHHTDSERDKGHP